MTTRRGYDLAEKLRRLAEHPSTNRHEAALARAALAHLATSRPSRLAVLLSDPPPPGIARVRIDGAWLLVAVELAHFEEVRDIVLDVCGIAGSIGGEVAVYTDEVEHRDAVADALRGSGWAVEIVETAALGAGERGPS